MPDEPGRMGGRLRNATCETLPFSFLVLWPVSGGGCLAGRTRGSTGSRSSPVEMAQRVVLALRELAVALEELQLESPWLFVGERGEEASGTLGGPSPPSTSTASAATGPTASSVAYHSDRRLYLVLVWPGDESKAGLYVCKWRQLEALLPGQP